MGITKPRSGRPKKLPEEDKSRILYVIAEQPRVTYKDLLSEVSYKVKKDSIRRLLNAENMGKWRCSWRPYLDEEHAIKCLQ
jgi:transposase